MQIQSEYHRYYLTACIKKHTYGTVYHGRAKYGDRADAVVKIFNMELTSLRERQRFLQEVNLYSSLRHLTLLPILETGIDKGKPYLIREYALAGSLSTLLAQQNGELLALPTAMDILMRIGMAISYLHEQNVRHGSIKPENILFDEHQQAFLADIHITSVLPDVSSTTHKLVMTSKGTEPHGVVQDDIWHGIQDDSYAFSSIAYELLTGHQPFASSSKRDVAPILPSHWVPALSNQVDQVLLRALSPQLEERFSSVGRFVNALQDAFIMTDIRIEEEDALLAQDQQHILLLPPAKQQRPIAIQKQLDQQHVASIISSTKARLSFPLPLLTRLPQLRSTLTPIKRQLPLSRSLPSRLPQSASSLRPSRLPQLATSFRPTKLPSSRLLLVWLSMLASLLSSAWARLRLSCSLRARLPLLVSLFSSAWARLPSPRPVLTWLLFALASALSSAWVRLPLPHSLRTRLPLLANPISSDWSRFPPPYPSSNPSISSHKSRSSLTRPLLDRPISFDRLRLPSLPLSLASLASRKKLAAIKLPFIIFTALFVLTSSILVSLFTLHPSSQHIATRNAPTQIPIIMLTAMSDANRPISISLQARQVQPKMTPHPALPPLPTIVNAGFEEPDLDGGFQYAPNGYGWTFSDEAGISSNGSFITQGSNNAPEGDQVGFIEAFSSIRQDVDIAGGTYRISLFAAQRVSSSSTQSFSVLVDDTVVGTVSPNGASYINYSTASFTVSSGIHTLQFKGLQGGVHNTAFIDAIAIIAG